MKNKSVIYLVISGLVILTSCKKYLNVVPDNIATLDYAFRDRASAQHYLFTCYSYLPRTMTGSDPAWAGDETWGLQASYLNNGVAIMFDGNNSSNPIANFWDGSNDDGLNHNNVMSLWQGIRDCNIFLENLDKVKDLEGFEKKRWIAEVKFLKAYYHFYLMRLYGPIPIVDKNLPVSATPSETAIYREPVDSVVNYIVNLIDEATPDLPLKIDNGISEDGRITQAISLSIKAKVLVTAASPLFNGNSDYTSMVDNRGIQLFNQVYDKTKWIRATEACKTAIDACTSAGITLYHFDNPVLNLSDSTRLVVQVGQIVTDKWNDETIWGRESSDNGYDELYRSSWVVERNTIPALAPNQRDFSFGGLIAPTLKSVEMFYSNNGVPIEEDKNYEYANRYDLTTVPLADKYYMQPGYTTAKLNLNREPRYYGSIGVDGGWWFGLGRINQDQQWPIDVKLGGASGRQGDNRYSTTSFFIKKLSNYQSIYNGTSYYNKPWDIPMFRLADLYLLYAEALNETMATPSAEVFKYVDMIRARAGLKGVAESWSNYSIYPQKYLTQNGMRDIIHRERDIELAFEGQHFYDMRRWKESVQNFSQPVKGWNVEGTSPEDFYQVKVLRSINYGLRDVLWPIKQSEILSNPNLIQNPGW